MQLISLLIKRLPFSADSDKVNLLGRTISLRENQLLVYVTPAITQQPYQKTDAAIPAVLDTGFNGGFCLHQLDLFTWAWESYRRVPHDQLFPLENPNHKTNRGPAQVRQGDVWLHPNQPGLSSPSGDAPLRLAFSDGLIVLTDPPPNPGSPTGAGILLPLLGMDALRVNGLQLSIDGRQQLAWLHFSLP